ncbi:hypothetical protein BG011_001269, partial [Mortierella polycephala]
MIRFDFEVVVGLTIRTVSVVRHHEYSRETSALPGSAAEVFLGQGLLVVELDLFEKFLEDIALLLRRWAASVWAGSLHDEGPDPVLDCSKTGAIRVSGNLYDPPQTLELLGALGITSSYLYRLGTAESWDLNPTNCFSRTLQ